MKYFSFSLLFLMILGCRMSNSKTLFYADGSNNTFTVTRTSITYTPVKPKMSSSGIYDGGDPVEKQLTDAQFEQVSDLFKQAVADTGNHIPNRMMTSGLVRIGDGDGDDARTIYLAPSSESKKILEDYLRSLIE